MRRLAKCLCGALCLVLLLGLLPSAALAADHWAKDAVETLNGIYDTGVFSAEDDPMTVEDLNALMEKTGWETGMADSGSGNLTRGTACAVLADVFDLPVPSDTSAIQYLNDRNTVTGRAGGNLAENDTVTKAEFAVLTYRVLNSVGGGLGSSVEALKPGTDEYFAWMYLAARACVPFRSTQMDTAISTAKLKNVGQNSVADATDEGVSGSELWNAWISRLNTLKDVGWGESGSDTKPANPSDESNTTLLAAAKEMVKAYIEAGGAATIFSDVVPGDYQNGGAYYDGVMYLFDRQIISGNGDGTFAPEQALPRQQLAALLYRYAGKPGLTTGQNELEAAKEYVTATERQYMTPADDTDWWTANATREEAIAAIVKACAEADDVNTANPHVLDRFSDGANVSDDAARYIAYAVSIGILNGNQDGTLGLSTGATRGQAGVLLYRTLIGLDESKMHDYEMLLPTTAPDPGQEEESPSETETDSNIDPPPDWLFTVQQQQQAVVPAPKSEVGA